MSAALPDPGFIVILAGGLTAVFALNEARHHLYQRWRARHTRPPVPGNAATPPAAAPAYPDGQTPAPGRARHSYRAPTGEDYGTCIGTIHTYDSGTAVILDHVRRRRIVCHPFPGDSDEAFLAHLEREVWDT